MYHQFYYNRKYIEIKRTLTLAALLKNFFGNKPERDSAMEGI